MLTVLKFKMYMDELCDCVGVPMSVSLPMSVSRRCAAMSPGCMSDLGSILMRY